MSGTLLVAMAGLGLSFLNAVWTFVIKPRREAADAIRLRAQQRRDDLADRMYDEIGEPLAALRDKTHSFWLSYEGVYLLGGGSHDAVEVDAEAARESTEVVAELLGTWRRHWEAFDDASPEATAVRDLHETVRSLGDSLRTPSGQTDELAGAFLDSYRVFRPIVFSRRE